MNQRLVRVLAAVVVGVVVGLIFGCAIDEAESAAPPPASRASVVKLQRQVASLQQQVGALRQQQQDTQAELTKTYELVVFVNDKDTCTTALTWDGIRIIVQWVSGQDIGRVDDQGACARVGIGRQFTKHRDPIQQLGALAVLANGP